MLNHRRRSERRNYRFSMHLVTPDPKSVPSARQSCLRIAMAAQNKLLVPDFLVGRLPGIYGVRRAHRRGTGAFHSRRLPKASVSVTETGVFRCEKRRSEKPDASQMWGHRPRLGVGIRSGGFAWQLVAQQPIGRSLQRSAAHRTLPA